VLFRSNRYTVDGRYYIPLGSIARILALHYLSSFTDTSGGHEIPFYLENSLGGLDNLRGFAAYRFRDRDLMYMSAEYRLETASWMEVSFIYEAGKVFSQSSEFDFQNLERSYGFGARFKSGKGWLFRIEAGKSGEGWQVYFRVGPSF